MYLAEAFASTAPEDGRVEGASASSVHGFSLLGPEEDLLRCPITADHQFGIVGSVLCERFNLNAVPGTDLENELQRTTEVAPVHVRRTDCEPMVKQSACLDDRASLRRQSRRGRCGAYRSGFASALKRPSALRCARTFGDLTGVLAAKVARGGPKPLFEQPIEIRGVPEAAAVERHRRPTCACRRARPGRPGRAQSAGLVDGC